MNKKQKEIKIGKAKGRPMLSWVGKRPLTSVKAYPAQHIESYDTASEHFEKAANYQEDWPDQFEQGGLLFHGDNKDVLAHLLANGFRGKVKLIYIDPPFDSGADYVRKVQLRGTKGTTKVDGEEYTLGEQIQYEDIWANDNYLQFMYERLLMLKELLAEDGSIYLHCDWHKSHFLRCLLDEVFGIDNFKNEVIWVRSTNPKGSQHESSKFDTYTDTIFVYTKNQKTILKTDLIRIKLNEMELKEKYHRYDEKGAFYDGPIIRSASMGERPNLVYEYKGYTPPSSGWRVKKKVLEKVDEEGDLGWSTNGVPFRKLRPADDKGKPIGNFWNDISLINSQAEERAGYPTQKPVELLSRIINVATAQNDIVFDCFNGSGTTAIAAQKLGRRWIGCDINKGAIQTTAKRLHAVMQAQSEEIENNKQGKLVEEADAPPAPAQLSFNSYRVNDYDLQIQHNEAVQLACEYIGITRKRTDAYFDGTIGNKLAKIIPFNHPMSPLDLEDLRNELERRPEEERDITLVCLGLELKARAWVEDYNRNRPVNKINLIELRTDRKYGGFIKHENLVLSVTVKREADKIRVSVNDVYSPSIVQRLNMDDGLFKAQIDDWRAVVDCIMIDTDYDAEIFKVALSDIPSRKQDLVSGEYELPATDKETTVAVKVIDMLGEEAVETVKV